MILVHYLSDQILSVREGNEQQINKHGECVPATNRSLAATVASQKEDQYNQKISKVLGNPA